MDYKAVQALKAVYHDFFKSGSGVIVYKAYRPLWRRLKFGSYGTRWKDVLKNDPCVWCGNPSESVDHIFTNNGNYRKRLHNEIIGSKVGACKICNHERGGRTILAFLIVRAKLWTWHSKPRRANSPGRRWNQK